MTVEEKIEEIQKEIESTKYNKATQHHIGKLKAKLAQLKSKAEQSKKSSGKGLGFGLKKEGHATVVMIGLPSVGKSTLLNKLTNAQSKIAAYEFTTLEVIPGMLNYESLHIQLLDLPGLIVGAAGGKGRGREVMSMVRNADLALIVLEVNRMDVGERIKDELEDTGIRLDKKRPDISVNKKDKGGVLVTRTTKNIKLDTRTIMEILNQNNIHNAQVILREDVSADEFIDHVMGNRIYIPSIVVVNKMEGKTDVKVPRGYIPISADRGINLDRLKELMFEKLDFIRVYMKPQGEKADMGEPLILKKGETIRDLCLKTHKDFLEKFRYAIVWGKSAKHDGQRCGLTHKLRDRDVITVVKEL